MHPFRSSNPAAGDPVDGNWPLVGSVFTYVEHDTPVVPTAVRPPNVPPRKPLSESERSLLVEGHWVPFDNTRLAVSGGYRRSPFPSSSSSSARKPDGPQPPPGSRHLVVEEQSLSLRKQQKQPAYFSKALQAATRAKAASKKLNLRKVPLSSVRSYRGPNGDPIAGNLQPTNPSVTMMNGCLVKRPINVPIST
ncbi:Uncharacterized protein PBTT_07600 [Plasmodiophora brassicae]